MLLPDTFHMRPLIDFVIRCCFLFVDHIFSCVFTVFPVAFSGGPEPRLPRRHEAGGGGPDGATSGVRSHRNQDRAQTPTHPF